MQKIIESLGRFLAESCGYILMLVMFMTAADVVLRNSGFAIFGIIETAVFLVIAAVYFGLAHCEEEDGHVRVTAVLNRLNAVPRQILRLVSSCVTLLVMGLAVYASTLSALSAWEGGDAVMANNIALYTWPARTAMVLGLALYWLQCCLTLKKEWRHLRLAMAGEDAS